MFKYIKLKKIIKEQEDILVEKSNKICELYDQIIIKEEQIQRLEKMLDADKKGFQQLSNEISKLQEQLKKRKVRVYLASQKKNYAAADAILTLQDDFNKNIKKNK